MLETPGQSLKRRSWLTEGKETEMERQTETTREGERERHTETRNKERQQEDKGRKRDKDRERERDREIMRDCSNIRYYLLRWLLRSVRMYSSCQVSMNEPMFSSEAILWT